MSNANQHAVTLLENVIYEGRRIDFDKMIFRINDLNINGDSLNEIECKVNRKYFDEHILRNIANRPIRILGILMYTLKGEPNYIDIDEIVQL